MPTFFPMAAGDLSDPSMAETGARLAALLTGSGDGIRDPGGSDLIFAPSIEIRPLARGTAPPDVWAVDGGQALVADARCLQVYATRAARVRWVDNRSVLEDEGVLKVHLLGLGESRHTLSALGSPVATDATVDVNLLRDWGEWEAVAACVQACTPGGTVLVDGDLQPDWRIPSGWLTELLRLATARRVLLTGVTKHTSLSWGGAPLLGVLERMAAAALGDRACWWVPVAHTRPDVRPEAEDGAAAGIQVVVARLDPDARYSFRVDLPAGIDPVEALGSLSALCDDAAFPGYPYPLCVADRLAACPGWVRDDVRSLLDEMLDAEGVPLDVRERAFTDRHRLMERS